MKDILKIALIFCIFILCVQAQLKNITKPMVSKDCTPERHGVFIMEESFRIIKTNPGYEISNHGRVRNRTTGKLMKPTHHCRFMDKVVYLRVELKNPRKKYLVHRLVAMEFLENPNRYNIINHKDENGFNNNVENLEWCTNKYNCTYSQGVPVHQFSVDGDFINSFESMSIAGEKTGSSFKLISAVCIGKRHTHNGYIWRHYL